MAVSQKSESLTRQSRRKLTGIKENVAAHQLLRGDSIYLHVAREAPRNHSKPPRAESRDVFWMLPNFEAFNAIASSGLGLVQWNIPAVRLVKC